MESHPAPAGARLTRRVARTGPCHAPAAPHPSGAADITASGLISRPAAASRFLSNLCARGRAGKAPSWALVRSRSPRVSGPRLSGSWATKIPARAPGGLRGPPHPACTLPAPSLARDAGGGSLSCLCHKKPRNGTSFPKKSPHGAPPAPPVSPWVMLGARSSPTARCWTRSSDRDAPCATTVPVTSGRTPG